MAIFVSVQKDKEEKEEKKHKELSQIVMSHISGMLKVIFLKFGLWNTDIGGHVHSKNCLVS